MDQKSKIGHRLTLNYLSSNLTVVLGLVLCWRGTWYVLDGVDYALFGGSHWWTGLGGIIVGFALLYFPDHDLKEIQKL